jgi:hypothetical protein
MHIHSLRTEWWGQIGYARGTSFAAYYVGAASLLLETGYAERLRGIPHESAI